MSYATALKTMPISFPGLFGDWSWNPDPVALHIGHGIYWYGVILALSMLCGMFLSMKQAKRYGLTEDDVSNLVLWAVPLCILGSRAYYVLFNLDAYRNAAGDLDWGAIIAVWDGGIAIYGTVIMGILTALGYALFRRIPFGAVADTAVLGLILGQAMGRWANLVNREAFGSATTLPWRMRLWYSQTAYMEVHPTFLYESLWNFMGLILLLAVISRARRFDGENLCFYFLWYGLGRLWIEGLRTDSLYLFDLSLFGARIRVSQMLSLCLMALGAFVLWIQVKVRKKTADSLYVNRLAAQAAEAQTAEAQAAAAQKAEARTTEAQAGTDAAQTDEQKADSRPDAVGTGPVRAQAGGRPETESAAERNTKTAPADEAAERTEGSNGNPA